MLGIRDFVPLVRVCLRLGALFRRGDVPEAGWLGDSERGVQLVLEAGELGGLGEFVVLAAEESLADRAELAVGCAMRRGRLPARPTSTSATERV